MTITATGNDGRRWFHIAGYSDAFGISLKGEYAITDDAAILDEDGVPLTDGDRETEAVRTAIESRK